MSVALDIPSTSQIEEPKRRFDATIESLLKEVLPSVSQDPELLHSAMHGAVLPVGKLLRPRLLMAVFDDCGGREKRRPVALRASVAVELIHCASLVHDDLPCFDDAPLRRGKPAIHRVFGESLAVLVGDSLISLAFEIVGSIELEDRLDYDLRARLVGMLARALGSVDGIIAGQAMEQEARFNDNDFLERYHARKTAALFRFSSIAGALAAGCREDTVQKWSDVGTQLGLAYQLLDDLLDAGEVADSALAGKSLGRDAALERPNGAHQLGVEGAGGALIGCLSRVREALGNEGVMVHRYIDTMMNLARVG